MLFRPEALKRLSSPEELRETIKVTSPMTWLLVVVLLFGFGVVLAWSVMGTIHTSVRGPAFIIYEDTELTEVVAKGSGTLTRLNVQQGDVVAAGDVVGIVSNPGLAGRLEEARRLADEAHKAIDDNLTTKKTELAEYDRLQRLRRTAMESRLAQATEMTEAYEKRLAGQEELLERGYTVVARVDEIRTEYFQSQQEMEAVRNEIAQLSLEREERVTQWNQKILELETRHSERLANVHELEDELERTGTIRTPVSGEVSTIIAIEGTYLNAGNPVLTVIMPSAHLDTLAFLNATDAKLVEPGMPVWISPATFKQEEYGTIIGSVTEVSRFPMSAEALFATLRNRELVDQFMQGGAPLLARVAMTYTPDGKLVWTSDKPTPAAVTAGTLASVSVVVREQSPITLVLPTLKRWSGLQ